MKGYVGDGHDNTFYIKELPGVYDACRIHGRRMAGFQATAVINDGSLLKARASGSGGEAEANFLAQKVIERIRGWEYFDGVKWKPFDDNTGRPLPVNAKSFGELSPKLMWRIRGIIMEDEPADADPETGAAVPTAEDSTKNSETGAGSS